MRLKIAIHESDCSCDVQKDGVGLRFYAWMMPPVYLSCSLPIDAVANIENSPFHEAEWLRQLTDQYKSSPVGFLHLGSGRDYGCEGPVDILRIYF